MTIRSKQLLFFVLLLACSGWVSVVVYRSTHFPWIIYRQGLNHFSENRFQEAIPALNSAIRNGISRIDAWMSLGDSYMATQRFEDALDVYEGLLRIDPDNVQGTWKAAGLYEQFGRFDESLQKVRQLHLVRPNDPAVLLRTARLLKYLGLWDDAAACYDRVLSDPSAPARIAVELAQIHIWKQEYPKAIERLRYALLNSPSDTQIRFWIARALFWGGNPEEAAVEYLRALGDPQ
ncbi:MAG: tetratricopeptide repeat protein [Thermodesulfobacteriota bacterium]